MKDSAPELNVSSSETEEDKEEAKPDGEKDPDFNQVRVKASFHCHTTCCARRAATSCPRHFSVPYVGYWFSAPFLIFPLS